MTVARTFRTAGIRPSSVPIWSRLSPAGPSFLRNLLFSHPAKVSRLITLNVNIRFSRALAFLPARNNNTHTKKKVFFGYPAVMDSSCSLRANILLPIVRIIFFEVRGSRNRCVTRSLHFTLARGRCSV